MKMWVFRITKGYSFDDPSSRFCPSGVNKERVKKEAEKCKKFEIDFNGDVEWVQDEANKGRLRQGWGLPKLDLRLEPAEWVENYLIACVKYWGYELGELNCKDAMGRKRILDNMKKMKIGDFVFIPKTPVSQKFTVATVSKKYDFDMNNYPEEDFRNNYRHVIEIETLKIFPNVILKPSNFGSPFFHAIDPIETHFRVYSILTNLIRDNGLI